MGKSLRPEEKREEEKVTYIYNCPKYVYFPFLFHKIQKSGPKVRRFLVFIRRPLLAVPATLVGQQVALILDSICA